MHGIYKTFPFIKTALRTGRLLFTINITPFHISRNVFLQQKLHKRTLDKLNFLYWRGVDLEGTDWHFEAGEFFLDFVEVHLSLFHLSPQQFQFIFHYSGISGYRVFYFFHSIHFVCIETSYLFPNSHHFNYHFLFLLFANKCAVL